MRSTLEDTLKEDIVKTLDKHITLVKGDNCTYSDSKEFLAWAWAGVNQISLREASEELNDCGYDVPSGDALLDRLSNQPYKILEHGFDQVFQDHISRARKQRLFTHSVITAIDFNDSEWYGEELPFIVKSKEKNGTKHFIRFATIAIVEDGKRFTLKALPVTPLSATENIVKELIAYVQSQSGAVKNDGFSLYDYGSKKLMDLHSKNSYLYVDKYFETCIPDVQTEFLFESIGLSECDYDAWLDDRGHFWVNRCNRDGILSEYVTPNIKGKRFNPYIRFLSSKTSGAEQVHKLLDLVGCNFVDIDINPFPTVFNLLALTFPFEISLLLLDSKKRGSVINKMWKCWKLFFKELHLYYNLPIRDYIMVVEKFCHHRVFLDIRINRLNIKVL